MVWLWVTGLALGSQDELRLPLAAPDRWLADVEGVTPIPVVLPGASLGVYPVGGPIHVWHGGTAVEVGLLSFGPNVAWTGGLSMDTIADDQNSIDFRLVRLYYDVHQEGRFRLGPGVMSVGYRHRCSHGADSSGGRILIRSGPSVGWLGSHTSGRWTWRGGGDLEWTLLGQNSDTSWQPRGLADAVGALEVDLGKRIAFVAGAGAGVVLLGSDAPWWWGPSAPIGPARGTGLTSIAAGPAVNGPGGTVRALLHLQRLLDSGWGDTASPTTLLAFEVEFGP